MAIPMVPLVGGLLLVLQHSFTVSLALVVYSGWHRWYWTSNLGGNETTSS